MTATYTFDVFSTLDGYGSYGPAGDWGGYWGKQGPELLAHRLAQYGEELDVVLMGGGALIGSAVEAGLVDVLSLHLAPVVLGGGVPLFTSGSQRRLVQRSSVSTPNATHLTYEAA